MAKLEVQVRVDDAGWKKLLQKPQAFVSTVCELCLGEYAQSSRDPLVLSVVLAGDDAVQALNHDYLGKNKPTNVLSFPIDRLNVGDLPKKQPDGTRLMGDIVLARETIQREAEEQKKDMKHHLTHLLVHGCLHLIGHDHMEEEEAGRMEKLEAEILARMDIKNPYRYTDHSA